MEAIAMGLSTQTTAPFKSSTSHHFLWSSTPCLRSSSMASHSSRRSFRSSSRKALHRRQECAALSAASPSASTVVLSPFQTARCSTSYSYRPLDMTQSTGWKLEVPMNGINDSSEVARMRSSKESSFTRGFRGLQRVEEETKQVDVKRLTQSAEWKLQIPTVGTKTTPKVARIHPDVGNQLSSVESSFSRGFSRPQRVEDGIRQREPDTSGPSSAVGNSWLEETEKLRAARIACYTNEYSSRDTGISSARTNMVLQSVQQGVRDGYACDGGGLVLSSTPALGCNNSDKTNLGVNMPLNYISRSESSYNSEGSASFQPGLVGKDLASCISVYAEANPAERDQEYMKFPSQQYSNSSLNSNTRVVRNPNVVGYSKADLSTPTRKQQDKDSGNKGHGSVNGGRDFYNPSFSGQNYSNRANMSNSYAGGSTRYYPKEYNQVDVQSKSLPHETILKQLKEASPRNINGGTQKDATEGVSFAEVALKTTTAPQPDCRERLFQIYDKVLVVDNISMAKNIVEKLTTQYRHCVHACDTEVANIDVKQETPVAHGEITCFSIYSGPEANFGDGKSCIWVDVLDGGGKNLLDVFAPFFEDPSIKKVWHNYSFDRHIIENYGFQVSGFHADTMHMARLWDSSRRTEGGYSLEALSSDPKVCPDKNLIGKISMKTIFGKRKLKKDGSEGKVVTIPAVEELQREDRKAWICYSALDSMSTLNLYESLKSKLSLMEWQLDSVTKGSMLDFYEKYWRPFGELLVEMEAEGMLVDRAYLAEIEKVAQAEQQLASNRFRGWASKYSPDAKYMNIGSDTQLRQLFFGGIPNSKKPEESLPEEKEFKIPNVEKVIEEGKKTATKFRTIKLRNLVPAMETELYTESGWPSVSGAALRTLAGKVSAEFDFTDETHQSDENLEDLFAKKPSAKKIKASRKGTESDYGTAYDAFGGGQRGKEACHAIAALCEVCSIDSLISNFILPLQGSHISGRNGRIHCSLNINTETGRLSARRPNLQNQPALEKDRYKIRQAFISAPGNSLIVADYGQLELRILAHLANCKSMLEAFKAGGDFHSRTAMNMYPHIREAVEKKEVLLEWDPQPGEEKPPVPLLKDAFASERRKAKMLNFSIAYGKTPVGLARDWKVSVKEAKETVQRWYSDRKEVLDWQKKRQYEARTYGRVHTLLGRARTFPSVYNATPSQKGHIDRAAINTPVQGSAADVAMCAMLRIAENARLKELGWKLLLQVHDEVILEGPTESAEEAKAIVVECMSKPFEGGKNILQVDLAVDSKIAGNWYEAK